MSLDNRRVWGLRAGNKGSAHEVFILQSVVVLDDSGMGDLSELEPDREVFYSKYREIHPEETRTGSAGVAGKFFRFAFEMSEGDLVVYPAKKGGQVYIGEISGEYIFVKNSEFPHQRAVKWKFVIPKSEFSTQARYELGAARTLFEIKRYRDELVRRINDDGVTRFKT